jgi:hypothetical protein
MTHASTVSIRVLRHTLGEKGIKGIAGEPASRGKAQDIRIDSCFLRASCGE